MCALNILPSLNHMHRRAQQGASMVEFAIVAIPILAIGLGTVELAHWFFTRQAIKLALLEAGRSAITSHINPHNIIQTFEAALQPLYAAPNRQLMRQRVQNALLERSSNISQAPWQITVLSPSANAYQDFASPALNIKGAANLRAINNNYLAEQHARNQKKQDGWINGTGPVSGQNIYEANSLVMHLYWPHKPLLSFGKPILKALGNANGSYAQRTFANGYLPMARQVTLVMQSHPVNWGNHSSGKVLYAGMQNEPWHQCKGWLCKNQLTEFNPTETDTEADSGTTNVSDPDSTNHSNTPDYLGGTDNNISKPPQHPEFMDNPECGVTLCCL